MKRNIVPLLGIAVVVAILSTGVFYGLFAGKLRSAPSDVAGQTLVVAARDLERGTVLEAGDLKVSQFRGTLEGSYSKPEQLAGATLLAAAKRGEPLLEERVISQTPKPGSTASSVPTGLRAVSIRVSESDGLVGLLRPGTKVDLQAVQDRNGGLELRTILQNVEVVAVSPQTQPGGGNRGPISIVTVLTRPEDADLVALADSGTRLRVSLRNPLDSGIAPSRALSLGALFQSASASALAGRIAGDVRSDNLLQLDLQVLRASPTAASQLESKLVHPLSGSAIAVVPYAEGAQSRELIEKLIAEHQLDILAQKSLSAGAGRAARFHAGPASGQLGIAFFAHVGKAGKPNLRVQPEITSQKSAGFETRLVDVELPAAGAFLVGGLFNDATDRSALERLYPGHSWTDGTLVIVVNWRQESLRELSSARAH